MPALAATALGRRPPEISIVMPVRDAGGSLERAVDSICAQTFSDWELVAVDDGSEDTTGRILAAWAAADPRIRIWRQGRLGIVPALNAGCAAARGRFIARMDADDWMTPDRLERQREFLGANPDLGLVSCRVRHAGNPEGQAGYALHVDWINSLIEPEEIARRRFVESPVAHPSVLFRRDLLDRHGGYAEGDFPEDYELWLRWLEAGVAFGKVNAELLAWNDPPSRLSRRDPRYSSDAFYRLKCRYLGRWIKREVASGRGLWLWGAGRVTRRRFESLDREGVPIVGFIDVDADKIGRSRDGRPVRAWHDLPPRDQAFVVAGVASRGAREFIAGELLGRGWVEGKDFLLAA